MLKVDALVATLLATVVTTAFFLLGAAILYRQGLKPEGIAVVDTISATFTEVYGEWSRSVFLIGAMLTLLSTMLAAPAANGRFFTRFLLQPRDCQPRSQRTDTAVHADNAMGLPAFCGPALSVFMPQQPEKLVILSHYVIGLAGTPIAILAICWMAFHTDRRLRMNKLTAVIFMVTVVVILALPRDWFRGPARVDRGRVIANKWPEDKLSTLSGWTRVVTARASPQIRT